MKTILSEKVARVIKNRKKLEKLLEIKISNRGKEIQIDGPAEKEYEATQIIDALNFGFPFKHAISIKEESNIFETINLKDYTTKKDHKRIRGRLIGKEGKVLKNLSNLTGCYLELKENKIGIIGPPEEIKRTSEAIISLIKGAKHSNVYKGLEKNQLQPIEDLGLKIEDKNL